MNLNCDELQQLTAIAALGALDGPETEALASRLRRDPVARDEFERFAAVALALIGAETPPSVKPPARLRDRVLRAIAGRPQVRPGEVAAAEPASTAMPVAAPVSSAGLRPGFRVVGPEAPWMPAPIPGARMKILSSGKDQEYAMLLIELGPGAVYPEHDHPGAEEMYILTGDLQTEGRSLGPGSFFHAEPGTHHRELRSIEGCTAIMVVPREALTGTAKA